MPEHPNATLIRTYLAHVDEFIRAHERGELPADGYDGEFFADNIVANYPGRSDLAGRHEGQDFSNKFSARLSQYKMRIVEVIDVLASDERAAAIVRERLEATDGRAIEFERVAIYRIVDGRIVEQTVRDEDQYAMDEFLMSTRDLHAA